MKPESHSLNNTGWLRAAVLGANDGIVSTASLILGVAAAHSSRSSLIASGVAGLVAGAMSMATGEYVSVSAQADSESAALAQESEELAADPRGEQSELTAIYVKRGLDPDLARRVAIQLMMRDALGSHARDELGLVPELAARPLQAAASSALSFAVGAALPLTIAISCSPRITIPAVALVSLASLFALGAWSAHVGGAAIARGAFRVVVWSALAMAITTLVGRWFGSL